MHALYPLTFTDEAKKKKGRASKEGWKAEARTVKGKPGEPHVPESERRQRLNSTDATEQLATCY